MLIIKLMLNYGAVLLSVLLLEQELPSAYHAQDERIHVSIRPYSSCAQVCMHHLSGK
jgi:hypothetical protein